MGFSPETYAIIAGKGGKANGFATLDENGKVPTSQIPSTAEPITSDTETTLTGVLTGDGSKVDSKAIDTSSLTNDNDHVPTSGTVKSALDSLFTTGVILYSGSIQTGSNITLSDNINNYRAFALIDNNTDGEATQTVNAYFGSSTTYPAIVASIVEYNSAYTVMVLADIALTSSDGIHYNCARAAQMNLGSNGVEYFSGNASATIVIKGFK